MLKKIVTKRILVVGAFLMMSSAELRPERRFSQFRDRLVEDRELPAVRTSDSTGPLSVRLVEAPTLDFPVISDSNSPAFWQFIEGRQLLFVMNSTGYPSISAGPNIRQLGDTQPVVYSSQANGGRWMEAVLTDAGGTLYGYYHYEPLGVCPDKTTPQIGAARSTDKGMTWEDLGIIIEAPPGTNECNTPNQYFAGGVGDLSAILDPSENSVYFFYSVYSGKTAKQGVAVARMLWADRDAPQGHVTFWESGIWRFPALRLSRRLEALPYSPDNWFVEYPDADPIYPASLSWHDRSGEVDAFWGPSVHWNTYLQQYVMLLNRAKDATWTQDGIYISFSPVLDDPSQWTTPVEILELDNTRWYPQVIGLEREGGTDKLAGAVARFFLTGRSDHFIVFSR